MDNLLTNFSALAVFLVIAAVGLIFLLVSFIFGEVLDHQIGFDGGVDGGEHAFLDLRAVSVFISDLLKQKIAKLLLVSLGLFFCSSERSVATTSPAANADAGHTAFGAEKIADLEDRSVNESSGIVASRAKNNRPNIFWTHNDSGDGPFLYSFDERGKKLGVWRVSGAQAVDWEDLAAGPGPIKRAPYLYVGDIGDNARKREYVVVYRVREPAVQKADALSTKERPRVTLPAESIKLKYPDGKHDAEALMVHPQTGDLYIISKKRGAEAANMIYKAAAPLNTSAVTILVKMGDLSLPPSPTFVPFAGQITGGDISPDGRRVALCDYFQGFELVLPPGSDRFDDIWRESVATMDLGPRRQGEAVCYAKDNLTLYATSEGEPCPLIKIKRRK